jgi:serine/threonine protein kinase
MSEKDCEEVSREISILKELDHPNIVKLVDFYEDKNHYCLVMELMKGGEVSQFLF